MRADLIDYFGTAMFGASPMVMMELEQVQKSWGDELIEIALKNGFDLSKYEEYEKNIIFVPRQQIEKVV